MAFIKFPRRNNESRKDKTALRRQRTQKTFGARYMGIGAEGHQKQESEIKKNCTHIPSPNSLVRTGVFPIFFSYSLII